jgi:hypothetical protein
MTNVANWPAAHQGKVMGLLAAGFGLSGVVFAPIGMLRVFRLKFTLDDAIEFHAFAPLEALPCV